MTTLSPNELLDVFLCLDRYTVDALPLVSRMFSETHRLVPSDVCLRVIRYIDLHRWYPGTKSHEPLRRLVRCVSLRDIEGHNKYRLFMDPKPPKAIARCVDVTDALVKLKEILRISYVKLLDIVSSPEHPLPRNFVDCMLHDGRNAGGVIRRLKLNVDMLIFGDTTQKLPLIDGRIVEVDLCRCGERTPWTVTDAFLQHAITSGVLRLRASYTQDNNTVISRLCWSGLAGPSDVREETIFAFCFAKRDKRHADDGRRELWLNGLTLPPGFLRRFVEACNSSDHVVDVKAYLHGDVCDQDTSGIPWRWDDDDTERGALASGDVPLNVRIRRADNLLVIQRGPFQESVFESKRSGMACPPPVFIGLPVDPNTDMRSL